MRTNSDAMSKDNVSTEMLELTCSKMVHEIKNPLTLVSSTLQLIENEYPEVRSNRHWGKLNSELHYINELLNEINVLSSAKRIQVENIDLGELIADCCDNFLPYCALKSIQLTLEIPEEILNICSDSVKLIEIFSNLIKNAIEATVEGGHVWVTVCIEEAGKEVKVMIEDDGCGISPEQKESIFKPFYTSKKTGTGLGLPIVVSILEQLGGLLKLESVVGTGTIFTITLPLDPL